MAQCLRPCRPGSKVKSRWGNVERRHIDLATDWCGFGDTRTAYYWAAKRLKKEGVLYQEEGLLQFSEQAFVKMVSGVEMALPTKNLYTDYKAVERLLRVGFTYKESGAYLEVARWFIATGGFSEVSTTSALVARALAIGEHTVQRARSRLTADGILIEKRKGYTGMSSLFRVNMQAAARLIEPLDVRPQDVRPQDNIIQFKTADATFA